jgi:hypothetical protein
MKTLGLCAMICFVMLRSTAQNTDLPSPTPNLQTLPANSYVIAMDNTNQKNNANVFNYKAYGLIVHLLNNNKKVKWVITAGKAKDATDISVNATRIKPTLGSAANFNFKAGPFVIFASDTAGVAALVDGFNAAISNANDKIKMYRTNASTSADIRYDLTGFIPKAAVLTDGGNQAIHMNYFAVCNVPTTNYSLLTGTQLTATCYSFASEPHNSKTGSAVDQAIASIKTFVQFGGNFLAQCEAVNNYENNPGGRFQTTTGITDANSNAGTAISYPNPDLSFSQFEGSYNISKGGSLKNWRINAAGTNNYHSHARATADNTVIGASVSKHFSGAGGLVFYIGNHQFDDDLTTQTSVNGLRMYMNAFLTPTTINRSCNMGEPTYPLPSRLIFFQGDVNEKNTVQLWWKITGNETIERFDVQRSINNSPFQTIASVFGTLHPGEEIYSLKETTASLTQLQYRLKMINRDQVVSYSRILLINKVPLPASTDSRLILGSNPVNTDLRFQLPVAGSEIMDVKIYDVTGRLKLTKKLNAGEAMNMISIPLPATMSRGLYILSVSNASAHYSAKFEKR